MSIASLSTLPKTGLEGLKENWRSDLLSGFLVFLIALPLCLGISVASGFPPSAGIITAIIGGMLVSRINGSFVTINGPAAGLIVVVLGAVEELGNGDPIAGYHYALAAIVVASAIQALLGIFKAGRLSSFFPASVVHGMLAAIGIIIMAKQVHTMLGQAPTKGSSLLSTIAQVPHSILNPNFEIAIIGLTGLAILIAWTFIKNPTLKMIPAPLIVVLVGIGLAKYFGLDQEHTYTFFSGAPEQSIGPKFLVAISDNFTSSFAFPDFSKLPTLEFWEAVISISLVGSLESLLSAMAVDKLDPYKRHANLDRDLTAVGIGNLVSGLIGGLPMIAEIVRSSANVNNGAKTQWANFFHGTFLLLFVVLFPQIIHNVGNTYFAVSGFDDAGLQNAANTALTENIDIDKALKAFCTIMTARYQYRMQQIQQYFPEKLQKFLTDGLGDVCFFGFINGQAKIQEVQFKVRLNKNHLEINYQVQQVAYLAVIGISKDIDNANPDELPDKQTMLGKPAVYVEKLVELEAKKRPLAVSEPIDLLELMPDGATWIKKSKDAVAIE